MDTLKKINSLLPGFNCKSCGFGRCDEFASHLIEEGLDISLCPFLNQPQFEQNKSEIHSLIKHKISFKHETPIGLIDKLKADFSLLPLDNECSCRETLVSFSPTKLAEGDLISYRPLGCPITHFAKILAIEHGLLTVHIVGPCKRLQTNTKPFKNVGICMVLSFSGKIQGKLPSVGQTVKFLPHHCMMGKVHSGVVVNIEKENAIIDCIDLKVWEHCKT